MTMQRVGFLCRAAVLGCFAFINSCASEPSAPPMDIVGNDRDEHGCIGSAGYSWCETTKRCERPWELAKEKGFTLSQAGFDSYCENPAK